MWEKVNFSLLEGLILPCLISVYVGNDVNGIAPLKSICITVTTWGEQSTDQGRTVHGECIAGIAPQGQ